MWTNMFTCFSCVLCCLPKIAIAFSSEYYSCRKHIALLSEGLGALIYSHAVIIINISSSLSCLTPFGGTAVVKTISFFDDSDVFAAIKFFKNEKLEVKNVLKLLQLACFLSSEHRPTVLRSYFWFVLTVYLVLVEGFWRAIFTLIYMFSLPVEDLVHCLVFILFFVQWDRIDFLLVVGYILGISLVIGLVIQCTMQFSLQK